MSYATGIIKWESDIVSKALGGLLEVLGAPIELNASFFFPFLTANRYEVERQMDGKDGYYLRAGGWDWPFNDVLGSDLLQVAGRVL